MLKSLRKLNATVVRRFGKKSRLSKPIKHEPRRLKELKTPEATDLTRNTGAYDAISKLKNRVDYNLNPVNFIPLSEADNTDERYKTMKIDKAKLNRYLRDVANKKLDERSRDVFLRELKRPSLMSEKAYVKNRINAQEWDKFRIEYYEKSEIKRLLAKQDLDIDNALAQFTEYKGDNTDIPKLVKKVEMIKTQSFTPQLKSIEFNPYLEYKQDMKELRESKIDDVINFENKNEKLSMLMASGFLDKSKSIAHVLSVARKIGEGDNRPLQLEGQDQDFKEIAASPQEEHVLATLICEDQKLGTRDSSYGTTPIDLYQFFVDFIKVDPKVREEVQLAVEKIGEVREYEEGLLESKAETSLEGRGYPTFSKLTPQEQVSYIAHNINDVTSLLTLASHLTSSSPAPGLPVLLSLFSAFCSCTSSRGVYSPATSSWLSLYVSSSPQYNDFLLFLSKKSKKMTFEEFSIFLLNCGKIQRKMLWGGQTKDSLMEGLGREWGRKIAQLEARDNKQELAPELGAALEGIQEMGLVNETMPRSDVDCTLRIIGSVTPYVQEGFTFTRLASFCLAILVNQKVTRKDIVPLIENLLEKGNELVPLMTQKGLIESIRILNSALSVRKITGISLEKIQQLAESVKMSLRINYWKTTKLGTLEDLSTMLLAAKSLDSRTRDLIKKRTLDALTEDQKYLNTTIPRIFENLSIAELRASNKFFEQVDEVFDLILLKSILRVRPMKYEVTKSHKVYSDILDLNLKHIDKLTEFDLLTYINSLCIIELQIEPFHFSMLDSEIKSRCEKKFNIRLASRMALLYQNYGLQNMANSWRELCLENIMSINTKDLDVISFLSITLAFEDSDYIEDKYREIYLQRAKYMSPTSLSMIYWRFGHRLSQEELLPIINQLSKFSFSEHSLERILLSQTKILEHVPHDSPINKTLNQSALDKSLLDWYDIVFQSSDSLRMTPRRLIAGFVQTLIRNKMTFKTNLIFEAAGHQTGYVPLFLDKYKTALFIYEDYMFTKDIRIVAKEDMNFEYRITPTMVLPRFLRQNEDIARSSGLIVKSYSVKQVIRMLEVAEGESLALGLDSLLDRKRLALITGQ